MKKRIGIWIDLRNAYLINPHPEEGENELEHLISNIEESSAKGGARGNSPWAPQGGDPRRAAQERRHHEEKAFFSTIIKHIPADAEELLIFGPAKAKFGLVNAIETVKNFPASIIGVEKADKMTENQLVAWVRQYFAQVVAE